MLILSISPLKLLFGYPLCLQTWCQVDFGSLEEWSTAPSCPEGAGFFLLFFPIGKVTLLHELAATGQVLTFSCDSHCMRTVHGGMYLLATPWWPPLTEFIWVDLRLFFCLFAFWFPVILETLSAGILSSTIVFSRDGCTAVLSPLLTQ